MKILFGHVVHSPGVGEWYKSIASQAGEGIEVHCFNVTLNPPGPALSWPELDHLWQNKDRALMEMYQRLQRAAEGCDIFLLYNGANIHPEFLQYLPTFNVYCCFDDPESSHNLSAPVVASFEAAFFGNIASRFQYENWGCKKLAWLPIFTAPGDVPSQAEGEKLLSLERDIDISLVCDRNFYREKRLAKLAEAFPQAKCYGNGWAAGKISTGELHDLYQRSKIGWNVHNSTGPINRRLFDLAGHGVLPICDNKTGLGQIFDLGKEVVGFDTIPEAVELTRYYLEHDEERRALAANAWRRFWRDYHAGAIWERIYLQLREWLDTASGTKSKNIVPLPKQTFRDVLAPLLHVTRQELRKVVQAGRQREGVRPDDILSHIHTIDERVYIGETVPAYTENPEMKFVNMAKERLSRGEPFEWPNMLALNWAVSSLIGNSNKIIEIGSGTGPFAAFASIDPDRTIHCFEEDDFARSWAEQNRCRPNVIYRKSYEGNLAQNYDLLVSMDVIEHVADMRGFLSFCGALAPRAIFTTPNRTVVRGPDDLGPPFYPPHVREFDAGEFYWILRQYYEKVLLYYMPDVYVPWLEPMTIITQGTPIIAECSEPYAL